MKIFKENNFYLKKDEKIEIIFNKNLSKRQKKLLNILILKINSLKIDKIIIKTETLLKGLELEKIEDLINYIEKVCEFKIQIFEKDKNFKYISYKIIGSFICTPSSCTFYIDNSFLELYKNPDSDIFEIQNIVKFYNEKSFSLYLLLEKKLKNEDSFIISLDEFKEILKIENKYERYFDIKIKVINPALNEINNSLKSSYKAIEFRKNSSPKSPVVGIKFVKEAKNKFFEKNLLDRLEKKISKKDYLKNRHIFFEFVEKNHWETLSKSIDFVEILQPLEFLKTLLYVLENTIYLQSIEEKTENTIFYLEKQFENINEITSLIISKLLEFESYDYYNQKLTKELSNFKFTNILFFQNDDFKIFAKYLVDKKAIIHIQKCEN
ncbi:hypothetical protein [Fusobacterium sp.]|uniref:hypothetical protein n=1 Tax=Fusobacterium sp. TaxID=68766 RepID=UPI00262B6CA3|nr:hypothetical protein [Fusobacterium sp.]